MLGGLGMGLAMPPRYISRDECFNEVMIGAGVGSAGPEQHAPGRGVVL